jgi:predicted phosphoribosyltransferase
VTARAALAAARREHPSRLVFAAPVCSPEAARMLETEADDVVCLDRPPSFMAVGEWYQNFDQLTDDDVLTALHGR